jgi:hypothetical protein
MEYLPIFIGVTAAAVVLQACILVAMYLAMRQTSSKVEALAEEVKTKVLPTAEIAHSMLVDMRPRIESAITNASEASTLVREQMQRLNATLNDVLDRTRLQVIRADEIVNRTMDHVEEASEAVHRTVVSPVRQISGIYRGIAVGLEALAGKRRERRSVAQQDEMFI